MTDVIGDYLRLGLRLGRHVDGLVDAYYGPPELAEEVDAEPPISPETLVRGADSLAAEVGTTPDLDDHRKAWLGDQIRGLRTYAGVLAGEAVSYADEVEQCYGVRPKRGSEDDYLDAHARLDELLPGIGLLHDRLESWRRDHMVPNAGLVPALTSVSEALRRRTSRLVELPQGERLTVEAVADEPWWAFNYYLGDLTSRVVINTDTSATAVDIIALAAHEVYPGHHTEHAVKEQRLVRDQGRLEEAIQLVPTPQALISEGIAEVGLDVILDDELQQELEVKLGAQGLRVDLAQAFEIGKARKSLARVSVDAALIIHEEGGSPDEAREHVERWGLGTSERAAQSVRFVTDPTWRAYVITYSAGHDLCAAYVGRDASRFRRLLTEQVRVSDLVTGG